LIGIWASGAAAHSPLESTTPANEAVVTEAPSEVLFDFKGDIRLTRVTMTHADHDGVKMDLTGHDGFIADYTIPLDGMGDGVYVIDWRGLGADGHALNGTFSFTVE
jgi:methionine-rich copper-binding protein CopC